MKIWHLLWGWLLENQYVKIPIPKNTVVAMVWFPLNEFGLSGAHPRDTGAQTLPLIIEGLRIGVGLRLFDLVWNERRDQECFRIIIRILRKRLGASKDYRRSATPHSTRVVGAPAWWYAGNLYLSDCDWAMSAAAEHEPW